MDTKALTAEFIGTFTLIFIGAGAAALNGSLVAVALAHGLVVLAFAFSYGSISGTHINPAVTIGLLVGKQIEFGKAVAYIIAQLLGGIVGAATLYYVLGAKAGTLGATVPADGIGTGQAFLLELLLTFLSCEHHLFHGGKRQGGQPGADRHRAHVGVLHPDGWPLDGRLVEPGADARTGAFQQRAECALDALDLLRRMSTGRSPCGPGVRRSEGRLADRCLRNCEPATGPTAGGSSRKTLLLSAPYTVRCATPELEKPASGRRF